MAKPAADIPEIYSRLLAQRYQERLFSDLKIDHREDRGRETLSACPFCQSENHFSYSSDKPIWRCWHCGRSGDWITYLLETRQAGDFKEALGLLAKAAGVDLPQYDQQAYQASVRRANILEAAQAFFVQELLDVQKTEPVIDYLEQRGYSPEEIDGMGLGAYCSRARLSESLRAQGYTEQELREAGLYTRGLGETHCLTMLWRDAGGRALGIVGRAIDSETKPKYLYSAGMAKDQGLIGFSQARGSQRVILTEGVLDALLLNTKGLEAPTVATGGTSLSDAQIRMLEASGTQELLLALDADTPGQDATERLLLKLRDSSLRPYVVSLPAGYKDPDELVRSQGAAALQEALEKAERWPKWLARRIVGKQDLTTDRGLDQAVYDALELWSSLEDGLLQRDFMDSLKQATGLSDEELLLRSHQQGQKAAREKQEQALRETGRRLREALQESDVLRGQEELERGLEQIRRARGIEMPEPYLLEDFTEDILLAKEGLKTGWQSLDAKIRLPQGAISIVAGRPGHGKTTLQLNLLLNLIQAYPERAFHFFSYEEAKRNLALKLIMILAGRLDKSQGKKEAIINQQFNQEAYIGYLRDSRGTNKAIEQALDTFRDYTASGRLWISDRALPGEDLAGVIGRTAAAGNVGAILIDYIQRIPLRQEIRAGQRYLEIKRVSELLLEQAIRHDLPIILGAQFNRAGLSQKGSPPRLEHLRESGDIEQDASLVIGLYNKTVEDLDEEGSGQKDLPRITELQTDVLKQRGGVQGARAWLNFDKPILGLTSSDTSKW